VSNRKPHARFRTVALFWRSSLPAAKQAGEAEGGEAGRRHRPGRRLRYRRQRTSLKQGDCHFAVSLPDAALQNLVCQPIVRAAATTAAAVKDPVVVISFAATAAAKTASAAAAAVVRGVCTLAAASAAPESAVPALPCANAPLETRVPVPGATADGAEPAVARSAPKEKPAAAVAPAGGPPPPLPPTPL
jgi:hypothetical protein